MDTKKTIEILEQKIENITNNNIPDENIESLYKLVDIHKDLKNEEYWEKKEEVLDMRYNNYRGDYGRDDYGYGREYSRGRSRDSRGRYMGEEIIEDMHESYQDYSAGKDEMIHGNYGAENVTMKSLDYMLKSVHEFIEMLKKDASTPEEMELIRKYTRKIGEQM